MDGPLKKRIFFIVISIHAFFLAWILFAEPPVQKKAPHRHLAVKTMMPQMTTKAEEISAVSLPVPKKSPPMPKRLEKKHPPLKQVQAKKPKPEKKKPVQQTRPKPLKKTPSPPSLSPKAKDLMQKLEESIAKIEEKHDKGHQQELLKTPSKIELLQIDHIKEVELPVSSETGEEAYQDLLIQNLKQSLNLPDYGEVTMQLIINADGSLANLTVLHAGSEKNKRYLEESLPLLQFPPFQGNLAGEKQQSFKLVFCNE